MDAASINMLCLMMHTPGDRIGLGLILLGGGVVLFRYRDDIGAYRNVFWNGPATPTPGCMLVPFSIALIALGALCLWDGITRSLGLDWLLCSSR